MPLKLSEGIYQRLTGAEIRRLSVISVVEAALFVVLALGAVDLLDGGESVLTYAGLYALLGSFVLLSLVQLVAYQRVAGFPAKQILVAVVSAGSAGFVGMVVFAVSPRTDPARAFVLLVVAGMVYASFRILVTTGNGDDKRARRRGKSKENGADRSGSEAGLGIFRGVAWLAALVTVGTGIGALDGSSIVPVLPNAVAYGGFAVYTIGTGVFGVLRRRSATSPPESVAATVELGVLVALVAGVGVYTFARGPGSDAVVFAVVGATILSVGAKSGAQEVPFLPYRLAGGGTNQRSRARQSG